MRIAILGAGPLGCFFGGLLARAGQDVTLIETDATILRAIAEQGIRVTGLVGHARRIRVPITADPATLGLIDLLIVCVRYWQIEAAIRLATPVIGPATAILALQAGWGDADEIAALVGPERTVIGLTAEVAVSAGPGRVKQLYGGMTWLDGYARGFPAGRLEAITAAFNQAGLSARREPALRERIWATLIAESCALPLCAILGYDARQLIEHAGTLDLMRGMHREAVAIAAALGILLDEEAQWQALYRQLEDATDPAEGLFQEMRRDLARLRRSDVDRLNGAIVAAGRRLGMPTPYNEAILWLIRAQERRDDGIQ